MSTEMENLTAHEFAVLESLHEADSAISQREIARRTGLSLGLINAVMKKLVSTGYIKTSRLNRRSIDYLLTPRGFAKTALRTYRYVLGVVRSYRKLEIGLKSVIDDLISHGVSKFYLHGEGELAELAASILSVDDRASLTRGIPFKCDKNSVLLNTTLEKLKNENCRTVDVLDVLRDKGVAIALNGTNGFLRKSELNLKGTK